MRPAQIKELLKALYAIRRTVCIEGSPGTGKTSLVQDTADELGVDYVERNLATVLPEDFGVPVPVNGVVRHLIPEWFPRDPDSKGILCFDDRNQAGPDLQKVVANICQARNLHGHKLPDGWMVVSTGNRQKDRAGANRVLSHLRNRETVIEMETNVDDWCDWASQNGVPEELSSFIRFRPALLDNFKPEQDINATPRSWTEGVGALIGVVPKHLELESFSGAVGEGPTAEFISFLQVYRDLPDPAIVLANPTTAKIPSSPNILYAMCGSLAGRVDKDTVSGFFTYIERLPAEFSVLAASMAMKNPTKIAMLSTTREWRDWTVKNMKTLY